MKTLINSTKRTHWFKCSVAFLTCLLFLSFPSCQKDGLNQDPTLKMDLVSTTTFATNSLVAYYDHKTFTRGYGAPFLETQKIENPDFNCFDGNFILNILNGSDKKTRVSSAEIWIDGILVAGPSDFSKNVSFITKPLSGLTPESILEVKLNSTPGSFIDLWIEGTIIVITPSFKQMGPLCQNSTAPELPLSSTNTPAIAGTWNPATISTETSGKTSYIFTPAAHQCATSVTMDIEVTTPVIPTFDQIGPLLQGSTPPDLPEISTNSITGTWDPQAILTATLGTFTFTFTPAAGQCATNETMDIVVTNKGEVSDFEGNLYKTIKIGNQWWMAENLKATQYSNGDLIGTTNPATKNITSEITPKYQWAYAGNESNVATYGRLYTWYAVIDVRNICPLDWHVPTTLEWQQLVNFLGGTGLAAPKLKEAGIAHWASPNIYSNNSSGFTALPGGLRNPGGFFSDLHNIGHFFSSTEVVPSSGGQVELRANYQYVYIEYVAKDYGHAIRCVKD